MSGRPTRGAWLRQPLTLNGTWRAVQHCFPPPDAVRRYKLIYGAVALLLVFSTFACVTYRVLGVPLVAVLPLIGTLFGYLWAILIADELFWLFPVHPGLSRCIHQIQRWTLLVMVGYGLIALALWGNSVSSQPLVYIPARLVGIRTFNFGPIAYRALTLEGVNNAPGQQTILGNPSDQRDLFSGQDVQLLTRRGLLGLPRVLMVHQDMEKYYHRVLAIAPNSRVALEGLVGIYGEPGNFAQAIAWDDTLRARYPAEYEATLHLGQRLTDAKRFAEAVTVLRKAAAVSQEYEVLYSLGYALAWAGQREEAAQYLIKATEVDPTDWRAFYSLGYVYSGLRKVPEARAAWTKVLELLPGFPEVEQNLRNLKARMP